ncbi:signal peptidase I [Haloferax profundi]|uniref:S26 family signal peptidase n=1 Tax=Haloferax profundi TaxID=1544718 RepID=A0A0W1SVC3_9EURY|nr:signal peptidase I [Haloferax profundi]KTG30388.1 S26 family signal peptidase [Haloferax profundi]
MNRSEFVEYAVLGFVLVVVVLLLFGQALGQPILLGYTETGSMAPTLEAGDGFIAIPSVLTAPPEPGDVIVFRAENLHGGGLTTHRVVDQTANGYITRGDANPFTDQDNVEPPVRESQIVAEALQFNGQVVAIPGLGSAVQVLHGAFGAVGGVFAGGTGLGTLFRGVSAPTLLVFTGVGFILLSIAVDVFGSNREPSTRSRRRPNYLSIGAVLFILVFILVAPATVSMVVSSGPTAVDIVSSESPSENPLVVEPGNAATVEYRVTNKGYIPTMIVVESNHPDVTLGQTVFVVPGQERATTTLTIRAPDQTGAYTRKITERRYLPILPRSLILALHAIHPWVAILVIDAVLVVGMLVIGVATLGIAPVRLRTASRDLSFIEQLKRRFL